MIIMTEILYLVFLIFINDAIAQFQSLTLSGYNFVIRKLSRYSVNVKCYLFKTYCSNLYCAPMWFDCTKTVLTNLKVATTIV